MKERKFLPLRADPFSGGKYYFQSESSPLAVYLFILKDQNTKTNTCNNIGTLDFPVNFICCRGNKSCHWINLKVVVGNA